MDTIGRSITEQNRLVLAVSRLTERSEAAAAAIARAGTREAAVADRPC
jgi:hypothetical protein